MGYLLYLFIVLSLLSHVSLSETGYYRSPQPSGKSKLIKRFRRSGGNKHFSDTAHDAKGYTFVQSDKTYRTDERNGQLFGYLSYGIRGLSDDTDGNSRDNVDVNKHSEERRFPYKEGDHMGRGRVGENENEGTYYVKPAQHSGTGDSYSIGEDVTMKNIDDPTALKATRMNNDEQSEEIVNQQKDDAAGGNKVSIDSVQGTGHTLGMSAYIGNGMMGEKTMNGKRELHKAKESVLSEDISERRQRERMKRVAQLPTTTSTDVCKSMLQTTSQSSVVETVQITASLLYQSPQILACRWMLPTSPVYGGSVDSVSIRIKYFSIVDSGSECRDDKFQIWRTENSSTPDTPLDTLCGCICPFRKTLRDVPGGIQLTFDMNPDRANLKRKVGGFKMFITLNFRKMKLKREHKIHVPSSSHSEISVRDVVTETIGCPFKSSCAYLLKFVTQYGSQINVRILGNRTAVISAYDGPDLGYKQLTYGRPNYEKDMFGWYDSLYPEVGFLSGGHCLTLWLDSSAIDSSASLRYFSRSAFIPTSYRLINCGVAGATMGYWSLNMITRVTIKRTDLNSNNYMCFLVVTVPRGYSVSANVSGQISSVDTRTCKSNGVVIYDGSVSVNNTATPICGSDISTAPTPLKTLSNVAHIVVYLYSKDGEERQSWITVTITASDRPNNLPTVVDNRSPRLLDMCTETSAETINSDYSKNTPGFPGFIDFFVIPSSAVRQATLCRKGCYIILSDGADNMDLLYIEMYIHMYYGRQLQITEYLDARFTKSIDKILRKGGDAFAITHYRFASISTRFLVVELSNSIAKIEYQIKPYTNIPCFYDITNSRSRINVTSASRQKNNVSDSDDNHRSKSDPNLQPVYYNNHVYILSEFATSRVARTLSSARDSCATYGGDLFSASTTDELEGIKTALATRWLATLLRQSFDTWHDILIGLHKTQAKRQDAYTVQPEDDRGYNCATMGIHSPRQSTSWKTVDCENIPTYVKFYMCEIPDDALKNKTANITLMMDNELEYPGDDEVMYRQGCNQSGIENSYRNETGNVDKSYSTYKYAQMTTEMTCPTHWTYINGHCWLLLHTDHSYSPYPSFSHARESCWDYDGQIADVTDLVTVKRYLGYTQYREAYRNIWVLSGNETACVRYGPTRDLIQTEHERLELHVHTHVGGGCLSNWLIEHQGDGLDEYSKLVENYFPLHCKYQNTMINEANRIAVFNVTCLPSHVMCVRDVTTIPEKCQTGYLQCDDLSCLSPDMICDGFSDCDNDEDERHCNLRDYTYSCAANETITISKYCDHVRDCSDGSDEKGCIFPPCSGDQYRCENGQCVDKAMRCNGQLDGCIDKSDELGCNREYCSTGFYCIEGSCLDRKREHDGKSDCQSGIDETYTTKYTKENHLRSVVQTCSATEGRCSVRNVGCFDRGEACVLGYGTDGMMSGCRDGTHLTNCSSFQCPGRYKCPHSYCIDMKRVCDGRQDCRYGEDEAECHDTRAPRLYRCGGHHKSAVDASQVCNGQFDCSHQESSSDEKYCGLPECPRGCVCRGFYYNCEGKIVDDTSISNDNFSVFARTLNLAKNNLGRIITDRLNFYSLPYLAILRLSYNGIKLFYGRAFDNLYNLLILDLRYNNISSLGQRMFKHLRRLKTLLLGGNYIKVLLANSFVGLPTISELNLSRLGISTMKAGALTGLLNLRTLDLSENQIDVIESNVFDPKHQLDLVVLTNNSLSDVDRRVFGNITSHFLQTDSFRFCCFRNPNITINCTPNFDVYSSCDDLMSNGFLQVAIWVIGCLAVVGNIAVMICRPIIGLKTPSEVCVFALSCSDFLTGIYLVILAGTDTYYRGDYIIHDVEWRQSMLCQLSGVLSTLSAQLSSFLLLLITLDRFVKLVFPMKAIRYSRKSTAVVCVILLVASILVSVFPIIVPSYFGDAYYGKTALCLAYDFQNRSAGWEYTVAMFITVNLLNCVVIFVCYVAIYCSVRRSSKRSDPTRKADVVLAKTLFILVITDLICWFPVITTGLYVINGGKVPRAMAATLAVVILPLNPALNPYLYTISSIQNARTRRRSERSVSDSRTSEERCRVPVTDDRTSDMRRRMAVATIERYRVPVEDGRSNGSRGYKSTTVAVSEGRYSYTTHM